MKIKTVDLFKVPEGIYIPYISGLLYRITSSIERKIIEKDASELRLNRHERSTKIIVSLTTFPARINSVEYAIRALFRQSVKPDRIVLWLAREQFPDFVPTISMKKMIDAGLEVKFCDDLRGHKKYFHSLLEQRENELIITYDDDLIYPEDSIEQLLKKHQQFPDCIICNRAQAIVEYRGQLQSYSTWKVLSNEGVKSPSSRLFPSTGSGTLYPYGSVNKEAFNVELMKQNALTADDLWMRFMSALNKTKIVKTRKYHRTFSTIEEFQGESLQEINCIGGENDRVVNRLSQNYSEALKEILGEQQ